MQSGTIEGPQTELEAEASEGPEPELESQTDPEAEAEPESELEPEPEPEPDQEPEPEPEPEQVQEPEPDPEPEPEPEPDYEAEDASEGVRLPKPGARFAGGCGPGGSGRAPPDQPLSPFIPRFLRAGALTGHSPSKPSGTWDPGLAGLDSHPGSTWPRIRWSE